MKTLLRTPATRALATTLAALAACATAGFSALHGCGRAPRILAVSTKDGGATNISNNASQQNTFQVKSLPQLRSSIESCVGSGRLVLKTDFFAPDDAAQRAKPGTSEAFIVSERYKEAGCVNELVQLNRDKSDAPLEPKLIELTKAGAKCAKPKFKAALCAALVNLEGLRKGAAKVSVLKAADNATQRIDELTRAAVAATATSAAVPAGTCADVKNEAGAFNAMFEQSGRATPIQDVPLVDVLALEADALNDPSRAARTSVNSDALTDGYLRALSNIADVAAANCKDGSYCTCNTSDTQGAVLELFKRCLPIISPDTAEARAVMDEFGQAWCGGDAVAQRRAFASLLRSYAFAAAR